MFDFLRFAQPPSARRNRTALFLGLAALLVAAGARAQFAVPSAGTQVLDTTALHPPAGARVAIVEFADMECPACARANPVVREAAAKYKIPWVRHDFIIPYHTWSPTAALNARWFDSKSKALGGEYRDEVFASQSSIYNLDQLRQFTQKFADDHKIQLPFAMDPQGKLAAEIKADSDLGRRTGITQTPTIFIVTSNSKGPPFIEVQHPDTQLFQVIDKALADTASPAKPAAKAAPAKPAAK
ncbi:MAG: thioredoxin domain-containing protein [Terracidiphilus sp.]|jgi:protein-disulfide isomerase